MFILLVKSGIFLLNASLVMEILILISIALIKSKSRRLRWAGHVARIEKDRSAFKILTGKPAGKRPMRRY